MGKGGSARYTIILLFLTTSITFADTTADRQMYKFDDLLKDQQEARKAEEMRTEDPYSMDDLTLENEAAEEGIPQSAVTPFVVRLKELNKEYREGSLTKTEYVQRKRDLVNLYK